MKKILHRRWLVVLTCLGVLCVGTIVGFRVGRNYMVSRTVEAGIYSMLDSGELDAETLYHLIDEQPGQDSAASSSASTSIVAGTSETVASTPQPPAAEGTESAAVSNVTGGTTSGSIAEELLKLPREQAVERLSEQIMKKIPVEEQNVIMNMVLSHLSPSEIAHIGSVALGNGTPEEKQEAKALLYSRFSAEEVETLKAFFYQCMDYLQ